MTADEHYRRAITLQRRAEELQRLAVRLDQEAQALDGWFLSVGTRLLPHVWDGPAAGRATEGYWQARHHVAVAIELLRTRIASIRARADVLLEDAAEHVRTGAAIDKAAEDDEAEQGEVELAPAQTITRTSTARTWNRGVLA